MNEGKVRTWPLDLSVGLWFTQLVAAGITSFFVLTRRWSVPHCGLSCDFHRLETAGDVFLVIAGTALLLSAVGLGLLWLRRPAGARFKAGDGVLPLVGIAVTIGAAVIAYHVSNVALHFT